MYKDLDKCESTVFMRPGDDTILLSSFAMTCSEFETKI